MTSLGTYPAFSHLYVLLVINGLGNCKKYFRHEMLRLKGMFDRKAHLGGGGIFDCESGLKRPLSTGPKFSVKRPFRKEFGNEKIVPVPHMLPKI